MNLLHVTQRGLGADGGADVSVSSGIEWFPKIGAHGRVPRPERVNVEFQHSDQRRSPPYSAQFWPVASEGPRRGAGNGAIFAIGHSRIVGKLGGGRPHVARPKTRGVEGKETEGLHQRVDAAVPEAESGGSSVTYARNQK